MPNEDESARWEGKTKNRIRFSFCCRGRSNPSIFSIKRKQQQHRQRTNIETEKQDINKINILRHPPDKLSPASWLFRFGSFLTLVQHRTGCWKRSGLVCSAWLGKLSRPIFSLNKDETKLESRYKAANANGNASPYTHSALTLPDLPNPTFDGFVPVPVLLLCGWIPYRMSQKLLGIVPCVI